MSAQHRHPTLCSIDEKSLIVNSETDVQTDSVIDHYPGFPKTVSPRTATSDRSSDTINEATIPPHNNHRTVILCFDGTGTWTFRLITTLSLWHVCFRRSIWRWCWLPLSIFNAIFHCTKPCFDRTLTSSIFCQCWRKTDLGSNSSTIRSVLHDHSYNRLTREQIPKGWDWNIYHPTDCETNDGKIAQDHGQYGWCAPQRPCHG